MADDDKKPEAEAAEKAADASEVPAAVEASAEADKAAEVTTEEAAMDAAPAEQAAVDTTAADEQAPAEEISAEEAAGSKLKTGAVVRVHQKVREGDRERIQVFQGTVIAKKGQDASSATITVRKVSGGVGVERIFPLRSPIIAKLEVVREYRTRRNKLYFLRNFKKKLREMTDKGAK